MGYLKQVNWIDIFALIVLFRISYIAVKTGFPAEIFKLFGTVLAIYLSCHYYIKLSILLDNFLPAKSESAINFLNLLVFVALACLGYFIFVVIRVVFRQLIKMEAVSILNRWGAYIFGLIRWGLFTSLLFFIITLTNIGYLKDSLSDSLMGSQLIKLAPRVYSSLWNSIVSHFEDEKQFNQQVFK